MDIIIVLMLVCGQPDTIIVKEPDQKATYTHNVKNPDVLDRVGKILQTNPTVIIYEDKRGICV